MRKNNSRGSSSKGAAKGSFSKGRDSEKHTSSGPYARKNKPAGAKPSFGAKRNERSEGSFDKRGKGRTERDSTAERSYGDRDEGVKYYRKLEQEEKKGGSREKRSYDNKAGYTKRKTDDKPFSKFSDRDKPKRKPFSPGNEGKSSSFDKKGRPDSVTSRRGDQEGKPYKKDYAPREGDKSSFDKRRSPSSDAPRRNDRDDKSFKKEYTPRTGNKPAFDKKRTSSSDAPRRNDRGEPGRKERSPERGSDKRYKEENEDQGNEYTMRLNRYIAHCGICSRRKADDLIREGKIKVNGKVVTEPGTLWNRGERVTYNGKTINPEEKLYILMNKPKNAITSTEDDKGRLTVMDIVTSGLDKHGLGHIRVYPIGRLDRNTTGVLLLTNDGDLAQELSHPSREVEKIYQVRLDKHVREEDMKALADGIELEDGPIHCDKIAFVHDLAKDEVGVEIHSGKNRIVRRMFEHLGYEVLKLDRVSYAGLTKKDLPRGKWRLLKPEELRRIKHFSKAQVKKKK